MAINLPGPPAPVYLFDDEFDGAAGSPPDPAKWVFDIGGPGAFGNNELETYTDDTANCYQDGSSNLVIRALSDSGGYTSARIKTLGKFTVCGGTWEARIKLPFAPGTWPAWWCMGANPPALWPACGEVDIVEAYGWDTRPYLETSVHIPDGRGGMIDTITGETRQDQPCDTGWHVYRMAWNTHPESFVFSKDGVAYLTTVPRAGTEWCYSAGNPFYTLLNLAIGGNGGGPVPAGFSSAEMLVDYVRVWLRCAEF